MAIFQYQAKSPEGPQQQDAPPASDTSTNWYQQQPGPAPRLRTFPSGVSEPTDVPFDIYYVDGHSNVSVALYKVFQYQANAYVPTGLTVSFDVSIDWFAQHPIPVLRKSTSHLKPFFSKDIFVPFSIIHSQTIAVQQYYIHPFGYQARSAGPTERFEEEDESIEWFKQHPDPEPILRKANRDTYFDIEPLADPPNESTEWFVDASQPIRPFKHPPVADWFAVDHPLDAANQSHEWYMQHPHPVLRPPYVGFRTDYEIELTPPGQNDVSVEWYQQHPIPVLRVLLTPFMFTGDVLRSRRRVVPSLLVESVREVDGYSARHIRHEQLVARIMNSLILQGEIVQESGVPAVGVWHLGVQPTVATDWTDDVPPETVQQLADRLAAAIMALAAEIGSSIRP